MFCNILSLFGVLLCSTAVYVPARFTQKSYGEALRLSILFYEAQRSGHLPESNRISWRGDSALEDRGEKGEDLTGGYYDASDFVKFGFTIAFTTTMLSWGVLSYKEAYQSAAQYDSALEAIKWASDYILKCHVSPFEFYGQVGDFSTDHRFWGRPEELNMTRPAYKIDINNPGSDLAGEASAALAVTSLVFGTVNRSYSEELLKHAEQLYEFGVTYRGLYHEVIPGAKTYYESSGYGDELTWAAVWLFKATKNNKYIEQAEEFYTRFRLKERPNEFYYNKKVAGLQVLLAQETKRPEYIEAVKSFCDYSAFEQKRTPKGLMYIDKFGTLSYAANAAFVCLQAADLNISRTQNVKFVKQQIDYMLGASGRSYLVGYGDNYPLQPHHSASSCPDLPAPCGWDQYNSTEANPQVLSGALVSGPDENDHYEDKREEFLYNEVTLDYNAGFQGCVAGLIQHMNDND